MLLNVDMQLLVSLPYLITSRLCMVVTLNIIKELCLDTGKKLLFVHFCGRLNVLKLSRLTMSIKPVVFV